MKITRIREFRESGVKTTRISFDVNPENGKAVVFPLDIADGGGVFAPDCAVKVTVDPGDITEWTAIEHHSPFWCRPVSGSELKDVPAKTQLLLLKCADRYAAILPFCGGGYTSELEYEDGALEIKVFSLAGGTGTCRMPCAIISFAGDPFEAVYACTEKASEIAGIPLRDERKYPELFEYLGWCSWDAMEIWVSEQGLLDKCREIREKNVPVRWAILDDMWADIEWEKELPPFTPHDISIPVMHHSKMRDFEADPKRFPHGLRGCVEAMKKEGFTVGIWHPVTGYWSGLVPGGKADEALFEYTRDVNGLILPGFADEAKAEGFFRTLHSFFRDCGAEFVKIDNQSCLRRRYGGTYPVETLASNMQKAIEASVGDYFGGTVINCMGLANENVFNRKSAVSRCSDDFQPENREWFSKHLLQCTFNGLFQGQFHVNDFDMWWTDDSQARKNSLLRAVSGGPVYVSDRQGRTVKEILDPLCFADGRICRCDRSALPMADNLFGDFTGSRRAFCVKNFCGDSAVVAAFNINAENLPVSGEIRPSELGFDGDCVIYDRFCKNAAVLSKGEKYAFTLENNDAYAIFILKKKEPVTVFGLADKFISTAAIVSENENSFTLYETGRVAWFDGSLHFTDIPEKTVNKKKPCGGLTKMF